MKKKVRLWCQAQEHLRNLLKAFDPDHPRFVFDARDGALTVVPVPAPAPAGGAAGVR